VHLVDAELDRGPILAQTAVVVREDDTLDELERRVHEAEHALYPATVARFLAGAGRRAGERWVWDPMVGGGTHA
jgi:phosphoribosylglycinamide formyltransferase-1